MRRTLPVLALIALLALAAAGCSGGGASGGGGAGAAPAVTDSGADSPDPTPSLDGGGPVPDQSQADAQVARSQVGQLMTRIGCHQPQLVETDPLSTQTGMCELTGDVIVAVFTSDTKRDQWVQQSVTAGLGTVVGHLWAVGVEEGSDAPVVAQKLGGTVN